MWEFLCSEEHQLLALAARLSLSPLSLQHSPVPNRGKKINSGSAVNKTNKGKAETWAELLVVPRLVCIEVHGLLEKTHC